MPAAAPGRVTAVATAALAAVVVAATATPAVAAGAVASVTVLPAAGAFTACVPVEVELTGTEGGPVTLDSTTPHVVVHVREMSATATQSVAFCDPATGVATSSSVTGTDPSSTAVHDAGLPAAGPDGRTTVRFGLRAAESGRAEVIAFADADADLNQDVGELASLGDATFADVPAAARTVRVTPSTHTMAPGAYMTLTAQVENAAGVSVLGAGVRFRVDGVGRLHDGSRDLTVTTDAFGHAQVRFGTSPSELGQAHVFAEIDPAVSGCDEPGEPAGVCTSVASVRVENPPPTSGPDPMPPAATPQASPAPTPSSSAPTEQPAVRSLTALPGAASALVAWQPPDGSTLPLHHYELVVTHNLTGEVTAFVPAIDPSMTSQLITGLTDGSTYQVEVVAVYFVLDGSTSRASAFTAVTPEASSAPLPTAYAPYTGESVTTSTGSAAPDEADPVVTTVSVPAGATGDAVSVTEETTTTDTAPAGYALLGQQVTITAPVASATEPLRLTFQLDASLIPAGTDPLTVTLVRTHDGQSVALPDCTTTDGTATPDPCIALREVDADGDLTLVALTSHASSWVAIAPAGHASTPILAPIRADGSSTFRVGSTVPVKISLRDGSAAVTDAVLPVSVQRVSGAPSAAGPAVSTTPSSGSLMRFDPVARQYVFNWATAGLPTGTYEVVVEGTRGPVRARLTLR